MQLDLCLSSIKSNFPESNENIVIHNNSEEFEQAHSTVQQEHPEVEFIKQGSSLFFDIYSAILRSNNLHICFFTDDDICFGKIEVAHAIDNILPNASVACISLRLGLNICKRSHNGQIGADALKNYNTSGDFILWPKTCYNYGSYWSYSLSVDGHIFRKNDILTMVDELQFLDEQYTWKQTPNAFESELQRFWTISPNVMAAPSHSKVVNSPNNRVQNHMLNAAGETYDVDQHWLLEKYVDGQRIKLENLTLPCIECPHTEINIMEGVL
tara:strand:- start:1898 stop:2704 length:807 start_codon:yes stop_codon:yes gene_type:complete